MAPSTTIWYRIYATIDINCHSRSPSSSLGARSQRVARGACMTWARQGVKATDACSPCVISDVPQHVPYSRRRDGSSSRTMPAQPWRARRRPPIASYRWRWQSLLPRTFFFLLNWGCAVRTELIVTGSAHSSHGLELFQGGTALHGVSLISLENLGHTSGGKNPFPSARVQAAVIDRRSPDTRGLRPARRRFWVGGGHSCWVYIGNYFLIDRLVWVRIIALLARANTEFINNWIRNKRNGKRQYFTIHNMSIAVETHHDERTKYGDQDIASKCRMSERNH